MTINESMLLRANLQPSENGMIEKLCMVHRALDWHIPNMEVSLPTDCDKGWGLN